MESFTIPKFWYNWVNLCILCLIKSIGGVVYKDSMLVFDEGCNRSDQWKKVHEKWEKIHIMGNFR